MARNKFNRGKRREWYVKVRASAPGPRGDYVDDETAEHHRAAIAMADDVSYGDLSEELQARLERMKSVPDQNGASDEAKSGGGC